jgi:hypothetical protein
MISPRHSVKVSVPGVQRILVVYLAHDGTGVLFSIWALPGLVPDMGFLFLFLFSRILHGSFKKRVVVDVPLTLYLPR